MNKIFGINNRYGQNELYIRLDANLSCKWWGDNWGEIFHFVETYVAHRRNIKLKVFFTNCVWADPIPMLSIILGLLHFKEDCGVSVEVFLPRLDTENAENKNYQKGQFLKFLATQGFLRILLDNFIIKDRVFTLDQRIITKYSNYKNRLFYNEAEVFRARTFTICNAESKKSIIKLVEDELHTTFRNTVSLQTFNVISEHIYNVLNELIENVFRHAYGEDEQKRFGLYIRKRYGATKNYGTDSKNARQQVEGREKANCPAMDNQILLEGDAVLEIFFVDIGMGLRGSLVDYYSTLKKNYKYPIRELFCKVLREGLRKNGGVALTPFGDLHFLCRVMQECNGYVWCNEGVEWVGSSCKKLLGDYPETTVDLTGTYNNHLHPGLAWDFRIPYSDTIKNKSSIASTWKGQPQEHPVFKAFQIIEKTISANNICVFDNNQDSTIYAHGKAKDWLDISQDQDFNEYAKRANAFIWFPKAFYSKNNIVKKAREYVERIRNADSGKEINLVIGDIVSHELICFFYAFDNFVCSKLGSENVKRIVLITNKLEVVCLDNVNNRFCNRTDIAESIYNIKANNSSTIYQSITVYALFLRGYGSYVFWNKILKYSADQLFINATVQWSEKTIEGYLDFERTYLYEDLYSLLKNALLRMTGCIRGANVEFRHIDNSSFRVCQDVSVESVPIENISTFTIFTCTVCASGYTRDAYYKNQNAHFNVNFFAHPSFSKEIENTAFLFIWPDDKTLDIIPHEDMMYYRLGKTGLISKCKHEQLISSSSAYKNTVRSKKDMYADFQQRYPKFIKYGHYHTDNHHYLVGFDVMTYMKYSYLKKDGALVYVLWKIISYLSKESDFEKNVLALKDKDWIDVIQKCSFTDTERGEVIVYHSNTITEHFMKYIREILPASLSTRIIPLNIVTVQAQGAPITFSTFIFEKLKSIFDYCTKEGILYIDSNFSTGRNMLEIENILLSTGCKRVDFFSLIDMRRLRNADTRSRSYWKINMPRLNDDSSCMICDALHKANTFTGSVESSCVERIKIWNNNWNCMSITNITADHGIDTVDGISVSTSENIHLSNSTVLNIYMAEMISETYSNDCVYQFIRKKTDLSIQQKMQLICTQICLYGNQNSRQLQLSLLCELVSNLAKQKEVNQYTSFAALILISQTESIMYELLNEILYLNQNSNVLSAKKHLLNSQNQDLIIAIGYFTKKHPLIEQLVNGYSAPESIFIRKLNEILIPDKDLKLLSKEFEGILVNELGRSRHSTNIQKLILEHASSLEAYGCQCDAALHDIYRMHDIVQKLPIALASSRLRDNEIFSKVRCSVTAVVNTLAIDKEEQQKNYLPQQQTQIRASEELLSAIKECQDSFMNVLRGYFITYSEEIKSYFEQMVHDQEMRHQKRIHVQVDGSENNKWFFWNQGIEKEFRYFLENVEHCTRKVSDDAEMEVSIRFEDNDLRIELKSWSNQMPDVVKLSFQKKNRLSKEQAKAFDVMFDFDSIDKEDGLFLLVTKMSVPACYQQLGGNGNGRR